jgi:hypothetical protein
MIIFNEVLHLIIMVLKFLNHARCRWLAPTTLATQEAELRRIAVQSQLGK